jgi:hypothetical protein
MPKTFKKMGRQAEEAVRGIKDKDLRREAFRILLLQYMAGGEIETNGKKHSISKAPARTTAAKPATPKRKLKLKLPKRAVKKHPNLARPGRRGGGEGTIAIQKLIDAGVFKTGRDAATIMKELARRKIKLEFSQLRMVLLRFARARKLKRRVKMKGKKVTYLYSVK